MVPSSQLAVNPLDVRSLLSAFGVLDVVPVVRTVKVPAGALPRLAAEPYRGRKGVRG